MPSEEHILPISTVHYSQPEQQQPQTKVCAKCLSTLVDPLSDYQVELDAHICASCREQLVAIRTPPVSLFTDVRPIVIDIEPGPLATHHEQTTPSSNRQDIPDFGTIEPLLSQKTSCSPPPHLEHSDSLVPSEPYDSPKSPFSISNINVFPPISPPLPQSVLTSEPIHPLTTVHQIGCNSQLLDPLVDITRIRVRSQGQHCLYPGARFTGTQKSGRNSYDVNVTIVVSFLYGLHAHNHLNKHSGCRFRILVSVWLPAHTRFDRRLARIDNLLRCGDYWFTTWVFDKELGSNGVGGHDPLVTISCFSAREAWTPKAPAYYVWSRARGGVHEMERTISGTRPSSTGYKRR